ncbi:MAG: hypothetical protein ABR540_19090 [Acidimicrobiales bacterium]
MSFRPRNVAVLALTALFAGSCGSETSFPKPPAQATIKMEEFRFEASGLGEGRTLVTLENAGRLQHQLTLITLAKDVPPLAEQLRSEKRRGAPTVVLLLRPPGTTTRFAVDLAPGRYGLVCLLTGPDGEQHGLKGMTYDFTVG